MISPVGRAALIGLCLGTWVVAAESPRRQLALVIGNAAYQAAPLRNPVNDATDMAAALMRLGFAVETLRDADRRGMEEAIEAFSQKLRGGGVGLFYFSGHGVQVGGENYLIPVGARINREQDVRYDAVPVGRVLNGMEDAGNGLNILILDACRDNPFGRGVRSSARGLAVVQAATGTLIAYATAPGSVADDGKERNGVYTQHLLQAITTPGLGVEQVFKRVRAAVVKATNGKQTPWEASSLTGDVYFGTPPRMPALSTQTEASLLEPTRKPAYGPWSRRRPIPKISGTSWRHIPLAALPRPRESSCGTWSARPRRRRQAARRWR